MYRYSSAACLTDLAVPLPPVAPGSTGTVEVNSVTGFPAQYPFSLTAEWDTNNAEVITVTQAPTGAGPYTFANCIRGDDGTLAPSHAAGASIVHGPVARDLYAGASDWIGVLMAAFGADPEGVNDSAPAFNAALTFAVPGVPVYIPAGTYKTLSTVTVPAGVALIGPSASFGVPAGNYGIGGLPLQGAVIRPGPTFTGYAGGAGVITMQASGTQNGGQRLQNITIDGSQAPPGNNMHGIVILDAVACVTLRDVTVYGAQNLGGDGLHAVASPSHPPDLLNMLSCHFAGMQGWGVTMSGVADSYITACEATGCASGGWNVINCNNTRFLGAKGEQSQNGPGWLFTALSGFTGIVHVLACTAQFNDQDGFRVTGSGTGTYQMIGCSADSDGTNSGSGGGSYAGLQVTSFAGTVLADGFNCRVTGSPAAPEYGVSMTSSNTLKVDNAKISGASAATHNGGSNTLFFVGPGAGGPGLTDWINAVTQYGADPTGTADSTTAIQAALNAAATGQVVYLPAGTYKISSALTLPAAVTIEGAAGWPSPDQDYGSVLVMSSAFSGTAALTMTCTSGTGIGAQVRNLGIDGSAASGSADGIAATGNVTNAVIENVFIWSPPGAGIDCTLSNSSGSPHGWHVRHVRIDTAGSNGINCGTATDCQWDDVHVINSAGHGWSVAGCPANSRFIGCRAEWSGTGKDGWHLVSSWNSSTGSGAVTFVGCSTDRNDQNGMNVLATGNVPLVLTGCMFRRDGRNGGSGGGNFAGLNISAATIPVIAGDIAVWPGVDDNGSAANSPQRGLSVTNSSYVQVNGGYIQGATTAVNNGGGNTSFFVSPAVITATGTTSAPAVNASPYLSAMLAASIGTGQSGDTNPRWQATSGGAMVLSSGAASPDVKLARTAASQVTLTDDGAGNTPELAITTAVSSAGVPLLGLTNNAGGDLAANIAVSGDTNSRWRIDSNGKQQWGPGNATQDTDLYRASSGVLQTDENLTATGYLSASRLIANGITGAAASVRHVGANTVGAPTSGTFVTGDVATDQQGGVFICTSGGTPGTWVSAGNKAGIFGTGSDGAIILDGSTAFAATFGTPSGSVYTQVRDVWCTNLTINNGVTLKTNNFRVFCQGTLTNNGTVENLGGGAPGSNASAGLVSGRAGGTGGTGVSGAGSSGGTSALGNAAGAGGAGVSGTGGSAGTAAVSVANAENEIFQTPFPALCGVGYYANLATSMMGGAGGGGGGSDSSSNAGGAGGQGGGPILICAWAVVNNGTVSVAASNGANGTGGNAGGGGGGTGGWVVAYTLTAWTAGTITTSGGNGGTKAGSGSNGSNGGAGWSLNVVVT